MFIAISHITFRIGIHTACNKPIRIQIGFSKPLCLEFQLGDNLHDICSISGHAAQPELSISISFYLSRKS